MDAEWTIRTARGSDFPQAVELWRTVGWSAGDDTGQRITESPSLELLVAVIDRRVVGTVLLSFDGWWGWVYRLAVADEHRNRGIAAALIHEAEEGLRQRGAGFINTIVNRENPASQRAFTKNGWALDDVCVRMTRRV